MKTYTLYALAFLQLFHLRAQSTDYADRMEHIFENIDKSKVTTGLLKDFGVCFNDVAAFNGTLTSSNHTDAIQWRSLYLSMHSMRVGTATSMTDPEVVFEAMNNAQDADPNVVLIPVLHYRYQQYKANAYTNGDVTVSNDRIFDVAGQQHSQQFLANDTIYKWQVGLNLYPHVKADELFEYALQPREDYLQVTFPVEFLIRKQYTLDKAFRLRLMGVFENFQDEDFNAADQDTKLRSLSIALGHEWQQVIGKRWEWYYGAEVQVRRAIWQTTTIDDMYYWSEIDEVVWHKREFEGVTDRLSLFPLLGARFQITPRLFASLEGSIEIFWEEYRYDSQSVFRDLQDLDSALGFGDSEFKFNQSGLRFLPYSGLYINLKL